MAPIAGTNICAAAFPVAGPLTQHATVTPYQGTKMVQTTFVNGNPWAGLHVPSTRKEAKEQRLKGWTKPPQAEDKIPTRTKKPRKLDNQPRGETVGTSILRPAQVREIAEMIAEADRLRERLNELTHKAIATKFGVGESAVYAIKRGLSWSSVTGITKGGTQ